MPVPRNGLDGCVRCQPARGWWEFLARDGGGDTRRRCHRCYAARCYAAPLSRHATVSSDMTPGCGDTGLR